MRKRASKDAEGRCVGMTWNKTHTLMNISMDGGGILFVLFFETV